MDWRILSATSRKELSFFRPEHKRSNSYNIKDRESIYETTAQHQNSHFLSRRCRLLNLHRRTAPLFSSSSSRSFRHQARDNAFLRNLDAETLLGDDDRFGVFGREPDEPHEIEEGRVSRIPGAEKLDCWRMKKVREL
jgi:hypothetical protein